jgi:hypothetical protein
MTPCVWGETDVTYKSNESCLINEAATKPLEVEFTPTIALNTFATIKFEEAECSNINEVSKNKLIAGITILIMGMLLILCCSSLVIYIKYKRLSDQYYTRMNMQ